MTDQQVPSELDAQTEVERIASEEGFRTIAEIFPELSISVEPVAWPRASYRLANVLRREGNPSWSDIGRMTPDGLVAPGGWRNFGRTSLLELLGRGVRHSAAYRRPLAHDAKACSDAPDGETSDRIEPVRAAEQVAHSLGDTPFSDIFPELCASSETIRWPGASERLRNVLHRQMDPSWIEISGRTPNMLIGSGGWNAFGARSLIEMLQRGIDLSPKVDSTTEVPSGVARVPNQVMDSLTLIGSWAYREHGVRTIGEAVELAGSLKGSDIPREVQTALLSVDKSDTSRLSTPWDDDYVFVEGLAYVFRDVDKRDLEILTSRELEPNRRERRKLAEIGNEAGLSRERVRQLEKASRRKVLSAVDSRPGLVTRRTANKLAREIGAAMPVESSRLLLRAFPPLTELEHVTVPTATKLLLWLGGPYLITDDWIVRGSAKALRQRSRDVLKDLLVRGVAQWGDAVEAIRSLGFVDRGIASEWLGTLSGFRRIDDLLVRWTGAIADKAEVVLEIHGGPMSRLEIVEALGYGSEASVGNQLSGDSRFLKLDRDSFGLTEWGGDEYLGIVGVIGREIDRAGGDLRMEDLVKTISERYSVATNSVTAYASGHHSFVVQYGIVRRRGADEPTMTVGDVCHEARCYRLQGGWALRKRVDRDLLRGSGLPIPPAFASEVGLRPGIALVKQSEHGSVNFSWADLRPTVGSIRRVANDLGAEEGDWLFLELVGEDEIRFHLLSADELDSAPSDADKFALLMGVVPSSYDADPLGEISRRLDLERRPNSLAAAGSLFRSRGEADLAELLPIESSNDVVADLLGLLGMGD